MFCLHDPHRCVYFRFFSMPTTILSREYFFIMTQLMQQLKFVSLSLLAVVGHFSRWVKAENVRLFVS